MTVKIADVITEMKIHAPVGVELPRTIDTNQVSEPTIQRWADEAAGAINMRRGKTTLKETTITLLEDVQDYALPTGTREVKKIIRSKNAPQSDFETLGVPDQQIAIGLGSFGTLASGQEITGSIDLINRQRLRRVRREDDWELFEGNLRFLFPIVKGEEIRVQYIVIDRTLAAVPDDRFELVLTFCLWKNLDWYLGRTGVNLAIDGDRFASDGQANLYRRRAELEDQWTAGLHGISQEVD